MKRRRMIALSARVYAGLLRLYPSRFRRLYGDQMLQIFRDSCRSGEHSRARVWFASLVDLLVNAFAERMEEMMTRRRLFGALRLIGGATAYMLSWLVLTGALVIIMYSLFISWERNSVPDGSFAAAVSDFFGSRAILLPLFMITLCQITAISKQTRTRTESHSRIYWRYAAINAVTVAISLVIARIGMVIVGALYPSTDVWTSDPRFGTGLTVWGLAVLGGIVAAYVRVAWKPPSIGRITPYLQAAV